MSAPFGHVFTVGRRIHFYDAHSNDILEVNRGLAAVLDPDFADPDGAPPAELREAAEAELAQARQEEGLFLPHRPRLVPRGPDDSPCDADLEHLILTVTERCNLRCGYCLHGAGLPWIRGHGTRSMPRETALSALHYFLDHCATDRAPIVSFYGGEPLLERDLVAAVVAVGRRHPRGRDAVYVVDTNGTLLSGRALDLIVEYGMHLQISLDGPAAVHDRHRRGLGGEATFHRITTNVERLLERDPSVARRLTFVVTLAPPVDLPAVSRFFDRFPPYERCGITTQPVVRVNIANLRGQDWPRRFDTAASLRAQVEDARREYLDAVAAGRRDHLSPVVRALFEPGILRIHGRTRAPLGETFTPGGNCLPGRHKLHVSVDGRLLPCEKTGDLLTIGDVENGLRQDAVQDMGEKFFAAVQDRCGRCWALRLCGVCFAHQTDHGDADGGGHPVPEAVCRGVRRDGEATLKMLVELLRMPAERRAFMARSPEPADPGEPD